MNNQEINAGTNTYISLNTNINEVEKTKPKNAMEFIKSCFGLNSDTNMSNCELACSLLHYKGEVNAENVKNDLAYKEISTRFTKQANFYLETHGDYVQVDLTFKTALDPELRLFWKQLCDFGEQLNDEQDKIYPILSFTAVSDKFLSWGFMSFMNPIYWVLQPEYPGSDNCNVIRMLFLTDNFSITEYDEDIDLASMQAEANRLNNTILTENRQ